MCALDLHALTSYNPTQRLHRLLQCVCEHRGANNHRCAAASATAQFPPQAPQRDAHNGTNVLRGRQTRGKQEVLIV